MPATPTEAETRQSILDRQLARAGWSAENCNLIEEFLLPDSPDQVAEARAAYQTGDEFADYGLLGRDARLLAIVEAKRTCRDSLAGKRQAGDYADHARAHYGFEPFIFLTNGESIWFWDRERYTPRLVSGFFTQDDLERLAFQRQYRQPLSQFSPDPRQLSFFADQRSFHLSTVQFVALASQLVSAQPRSSFLLCLDDLDRLLMNCNDHEMIRILDFISYLFEKTRLPFQFLVTVAQITRKIGNSYSSTFLSSAVYVQLRPWSLEQTYEFVEQCAGGQLVFDSVSSQELFAATGGHPYLTKAVLQTLAGQRQPASKPLIVSPALVQRAVEDCLCQVQVSLVLTNISEQLSSNQNSYLVLRDMNEDLRAGMLQQWLERKRSAPPTVSTNWQAQLRQTLIEHFNDEELRTLCFDLKVDYENLPASTKDGKTRELVAYLERSERIPELVQLCRELRPNVAWDRKSETGS